MKIIWMTLAAILVVGNADLRSVWAEKMRPNILWLSCEDISPHLGCYGAAQAITPNLDRLARQGTRFTNAFTAAGVCAPCRSTIITGMYQNSIGTHHMRCKAELPEWLRPFPMLLREAGYYCTNNSKTDYQFASPSPKKIWDESSSTAHWKNREPDQPFFAVFNFTGCHESGIASDAKYEQVTRVLSEAQRQDANRLKLPPYYPDTPETREDWKRYFELITAMDHWVGEHLRELKEAGLTDDTIVMFWSDHGVGLPRAKRWLYDSGTRIPLIFKVPEKFRIEDQALPGSVSDALVSSVDFAPTTLNLAGLEVPTYMQGQPVLAKDLPAERKFVFGARDRMDERYDIIRTARDKRFRYIRNFEPYKPYYQYMNTPEKGATMRAIRQAEQRGSLPPLAQQFSAPSKPSEELYDLESDPHEVHNLASNPTYQQRLEQMRDACLRWQFEIGDLGLIPEAEIEIRQAGVGNRYDILRQANVADSLAKLIDIADKASASESAVSELLDALPEPDAAIRYWAATGLANAIQDGRLPDQLRDEVGQDLKKSLTDASPNVRIAAARGLCWMGNTEAGLAVLESELAGQHQWGRLAAAIALDELDEKARPALPSLKVALQNQPNKYIVRVANKALNDLQGTENTVP